MEEFVFMGYRFYEVNNTNGTSNKGYTLYMLEPLKQELGSYGFHPVQVYNRYQNCMKFPTVSPEFFEEHNIKDIKPSDKVLVSISRNHVTEFKKK